MAKRIITDTVDDLDGAPGAETVTFALNGVVYEIDLTSKNAKKLESALAPFIEKARRTTSVRLMRVTKLGRTGQSK